MRKVNAVWMVALLGTLLAAGCGVVDNLTGGSGDDGPVVRGRFVGLGGAEKLGGVSAFSSAADDITVKVLEDPSIDVKVSGDGTFVLRGLPSGRFTVIFMQGGVEIGRQVFEEVQPNHEITVTLELVDGEVVVIDEKRTGIGHGDIEIEGEIEDIMSISTTGDSKLKIDGKTVIVRPGVTAIREGNRALLVSELEEGMQVHVKGVWIEGSRTDVLAHEIKLQDDEVDDIGTGGKATICHIPPGNPANRKTLEVGQSAVPAHMGHGDTMGPCSGADPEPRNKGGKPDDKGKPDKDKGPKK
jgi:hypothetical protein